MKAKSNKKSSIAGLLEAAGHLEDKEEKKPPYMIVPKPIRAVSSNAVSPEKFKAALRKIGRAFGFKLTVTDDFSGLSMRIYAEYVGKVHVFEPSIKEHSDANSSNKS